MRSNTSQKTPFLTEYRTDIGGHEWKTSGNAAWGTSANDTLYEAGDLNATIQIANQTIHPQPGHQDLPDGDLRIIYALGTNGQKTITFHPESIEVTVHHINTFTEIIPLLKKTSDIIQIQDDTLTLKRNDTTFTISSDQSLTGKYFFISMDLFETITPIDDPPDAFKTVFMPMTSDLPDFPKAIGHMQYSPLVFLDSNTVIKSFTYRNDEVKNWVTTAKCTLENNTLQAIALGNAHTIENSRRGLYEPHLVRWQNRFYMTGRAEDKRGYLLISDDGLTWSTPQPWRWDNGEEIPMDQTMSKLLSHPDGLVLVYTCICDDNTKTFRHRAPLHVADLDPQTNRLIRSTERIIVPDKGMAVGNFWAWSLTQEETLIFTAEWPRDGRPTNGDIWICRIKWRNPNTDITPEGAIRISK